MAKGTVSTLLNIIRRPTGRFYLFISLLQKSYTWYSERKHKLINNNCSTSSTVVADKITVLYIERQYVTI